MNTVWENVDKFEELIAEYAGSKYAVAVDSCTNALFLSLKYCKDFLGYESNSIDIPKKTYISVPMQTIHAGFKVNFKDIKWSGSYQLNPLPIIDSAQRFTKDMYIKNTFYCLSFNFKKILSTGKGGMILTDSKEAVEWFKKARYEGRSEKYYKEDSIEQIGWNMYMTPQEAAHGLALMQNYPQHSPDIKEINGYRDLTEFPVFKDCKIING